MSSTPVPDRSPARRGRRRPWLLLGAALVCPATAAALWWTFGAARGVVVVLAAQGVVAALAGLVHLRARRHRRPSVTSDPGRLGSLTTEQLCHLWRVSSQALGGPVDDVRRADLAVLRQQYLDELERRDPTGFALWLQQHPLPGTDPSPWLALE